MLQQGLVHVDTIDLVPLVNKGHADCKKEKVVEQKATDLEPCC